MRANSEKISGFTLVELLVVISIIALLLSIMLPALQRARESAKQIVCLANMRSAGQIWLMYANDNKGTIVPTNGKKSSETWFDRLSVYLTKKTVTRTVYPKKPARNMFTCPSIDAFYMDDYDNTYAFNYAINTHCGILWSNGTSQWIPTKLMDIKTPSQKIIFADGRVTKEISSGTGHPKVWTGFWTDPTNYYKSVNYYVGTPHKGGKAASFVWADGHSSSETRMNWDTKNPSDRTGAGWWILTGK